MVEGACLVLRLAGPLQSWGSRSQFNRRGTEEEPTKSGIIGLLAAAQGRRRVDPIDDLLSLRLGVRTDEPGSLLRDYHTVSDYRGRPLLSAAVTARGVQKPTSPAKLTHVTERFYVQDAVFVAAVGGPARVLEGLSEALRHPAFPLALGRRSCVPTQPLVLDAAAGEGHGVAPQLWDGPPIHVLARVPWQVGDFVRRRVQAQVLSGDLDVAELPVTVDDPDGDDLRVDLPSSFNSRYRSFTSRRVRQAWVRPPGLPTAPPVDEHDPFALLEQNT